MEDIKKLISDWSKGTENDKIQNDRNSIEQKFIRIKIAMKIQMEKGNKTQNRKWIEKSK